MPFSLSGCRISRPIVSFFILTNRAKNGRLNDLLLIVMGDYPLQCSAMAQTFVFEISLAFSMGTFLLIKWKHNISCRLTRRCGPTLRRRSACRRRG
jgi:hypothetical protein